MTTDSQAFQPNAPASEQALVSLVAGVAAPLPDAYMAFLRRANGGEGFIGERYVRLYRAEDLIEINRGYKVAEFFPNPVFYWDGWWRGGIRLQHFWTHPHRVRGSVYRTTERCEDDCEFVRFVHRQGEHQTLIP